MRAESRNEVGDQVHLGDPCRTEFFCTAKAEMGGRVGSGVRCEAAMTIMIAFDAICHSSPGKENVHDA